MAGLAGIDHLRQQVDTLKDLAQKVRMPPSKIAGTFDKLQKQCKLTEQQNAVCAPAILFVDPDRMNFKCCSTRM